MGCKIKLKQLIFILSFVFILKIPDINALELKPDSWKVGVSVFNTDFQDVSAASAAVHIPELILQNLEDCAAHVLSDNDKEVILENYIKEQKTALYKNLAGLNNQLDSIRFKPMQDTEPVEELKEKIKQLRSDLVTIEKIKPGDIDFPKNIPVSFEGADGESDLLDINIFSPEAYLDTSGLDMLITGNISRIGSYYGVAVSAYLHGKKIKLWEGASEEKDFRNIALEASDKARSLILNRPWCGITVQSDPPDASIVLNGKPAGTGFFSDNSLPPGDYTIEILSYGYSPEIINTNIKNTGRLNLSPVLKKTEIPEIIISSEPSSADVWLGGLWLGKTPLNAPLPQTVMPLTFKIDGYRSRTVPLYPGGEQLSVQLEPLVSDPAEDLADARKKMYTAIAFFSFSLAPTVILLGIANNYAQMNFNSTSPEDYEKSYNAYNLTYGLMWGSVAVNAGLLTWTIVKIFKYLKQAEKLSE